MFVWVFIVLCFVLVFNVCVGIYCFMFCVGVQCLCGYLLFYVLCWCSMFVWVFIVLCQCLLFNECLLSFYLVVVLLLLKDDMCYNLVRIFFCYSVGVFVVSWLYYIYLLLWNTWIQFHNWNGVIFSRLIFNLITRLQFGLIMVKEVYLSVIHCYNRMKGYVSNRILKTTRRGHFSGRLIKLIFNFII
jgi:hypothetical protein